MPKPMTDEEKARRERKTKSVRGLAGQIQGLRAKVTKDLKSDDEKVKLTALAVTLMDRTAERVGNDESADNGHFGVTGWRAKHVTVEGNKVTLKYVGKSGVKQEKSFSDEFIAKMVKDCKERCGKEGGTILCTTDGFRIKADKVNRYLEEFDITAKDIRGYAANSMMVEILKGSKISDDQEERKKKFKEAIKTVAAKVGHQQATLKKHYLLPGIEKDYVGSGKVPSVKEASFSGRVSRIASRLAAEERLLIENKEQWQQVVDHARKVIPEVLAAHVRVFGGPAPHDGKFFVGVNDWDLPEGKVGSYKFRHDGEDGVLTISPRAFDGKGAPYDIVTTHELIHWAMGECGFDNGNHGEQFQAMAEELGIPAPYRD